MHCSRWQRSQPGYSTHLTLGGQPVEFADAVDVGVCAHAPCQNTLSTLLAFNRRHGVTEYSSSLNYWHSAGGINEGMSDVMAACGAFWHMARQLAWVSTGAALHDQ